MAEATETGQTSESTAPEPFVTLSDGEETFASEDEAEATTEASEEAGEETPESAAAEEDSPEPPTAEELGYDLTNPRDKAAFTAMMKKWGQWTNRFNAKHASKPEAAPAAQPQETPAPQAEAASDDPIAEVYKVDLDSWEPQLAQDSDLAPYASELKDLVKQAIQHTLAGVKANDERLRQRMTQAERETKARGVIEAYAKEIADHPEAQEKAAELQQLAQRYRQLAIDDPETFVEIIERKTGLERGWRGQAEEEVVREGQRNRQIATKLRSVVARPTRAAPARASGTGSMDFESGFNAALRKAGLA